MPLEFPGSGSLAQVAPPSPEDHAIPCSRAGPLAATATTVPGSATTSAIMPTSEESGRSTSCQVRSATDAAGVADCALLAEATAAAVGATETAGDDVEGAAVSAVPQPARARQAMSAGSDPASRRRP